MAPAPEDGRSEDGRSARSQRTRDAVVESLLAWIRDGNLRPTAKDIAERAGISVRSVYVHFDDLDDLFCAASARQGRDLAAVIEVIPTDLPFAERLDRFVDQRARAFEMVMPVKRAAALQEPFSQPLAQLLDGMRRLQRDELARLFAAELDGAPVDERDARLEAAHVLSVEESWSHLRNHGRLGVAETAAAVRVGLRAVLDPGRGSEA
jgi:AcrR family transcriptional regulator